MPHKLSVCTTETVFFICSISQEHVQTRMRRRITSHRNFLHLWDWPSLHSHNSCHFLCMVSQGSLLVAMDTDHRKLTEMAALRRYEWKLATMKQLLACKTFLKPKEIKMNKKGFERPLNCCLTYVNKVTN